MEITFPTREEKTRLESSRMMFRFAYQVSRTSWKVVAKRRLLFSASWVDMCLFTLPLIHSTTLTTCSSRSSFSKNLVVLIVVADISSTFCTTVVYAVLLSQQMIDDRLVY
jgi:hypothetical protein